MMSCLIPAVHPFTPTPAAPSGDEGSETVSVDTKSGFPIPRFLGLAGAIPFFMNTSWAGPDYPFPLLNSRLSKSDSNPEQ